MPDIKKAVRATRMSYDIFRCFVQPLPLIVRIQIKKLNIKTKGAFETKTKNPSLIGQLASVDVKQH